MGIGGRDTGPRGAQVRRRGDVIEVEVPERRRGHRADAVPTGDPVVVLLDGHGPVSHGRHPGDVADAACVRLGDGTDGRDVVDQVAELGGGLVPVAGVAPVHTAEVVLEVGQPVGHPQPPGDEAGAVAQREAPRVAVRAVVEPDVLGALARRGWGGGLVGLPRLARSVRTGRSCPACPGSRARCGRPESWAAAARGDTCPGRHRGSRPRHRRTTTPAPGTPDSPRQLREGPRRVGGRAGSLVGVASLAPFLSGTTKVAWSTRTRWRTPEPLPAATRHPADTRHRSRVDTLTR